MAVKIIKTNQMSEEDFGAVKLKNLFSDPENEHVSIAVVRVSGMNRKHLHQRSESFFFVMEGSGNFVVEEEVYDVVPGDFLHIPKNTVYVESGQMTLMVITSPRYDASQVQYFDTTE